MTQIRGLIRRQRKKKKSHTIHQKQIKEAHKERNTDLFCYLLNDIFRQSVSRRRWCRSLIQIRFMLPNSTPKVLMAMVHPMARRRNSKLRAHRRRRRGQRTMVNYVHDWLLMMMRMMMVGVVVDLDPTGSVIHRRRPRHELGSAGVEAAEGDAVRGGIGGGFGPQRIADAVVGDF